MCKAYSLSGLVTLKDVASYVIARTLGVIDATKASTSGGHDRADAKPSIVVHSDSESNTSNSSSHMQPDPSRDEFDGAGLPHTTPPASYFRNPTEEEGNLQLSGVGTFSPAPSQPGSPTLQRREFIQHAPHFGDHLSADASGTRLGADEGEYEDHDDGGSAGSGAATPRDMSGLGSSSAGSSSGDSSFAILDRDSGSEDAGVVLRRRTLRPGTPPSTGPETEHGAA